MTSEANVSPLPWRRKHTSGSVEARGIARDPPQTELVPIERLRRADSPRLHGEDPGHIRALAEAESLLPPILVHRPSMRVIDGMHRLSAARLRGRDTVEVRFFDGTDAEAFVLAVKANIAHGLPLSRADREAAVHRIMTAYPHWSDRAIASATGVSASTVAVIRRRNGMDCRTNRVGRDGRVRPMDAAAGRRLASQLIIERPAASLREIASAAGVSPATVRDVRNRMYRGEHPVPDSQRDGAASGRSRGARAPDHAEILRRLRSDPALRFAESGRALLRWLHTHAIRAEEWRMLAEAAPPHCAHLIAGLAQGYAQEWLDFARQMERQAGACGPGQS